MTATGPIMQYDGNGLLLLKKRNKHLEKRKHGKNEENIGDFIYTLKGHKPLEKRKDGQNEENIGDFIYTLKGHHFY